MLLTFLRLLKIVQAIGSTKRGTTEFIYKLIRADCGSLAWFWEKIGVNSNEPFHTQFRNSEFSILGIKDFVNLR